MGRSVLIFFLAAWRGIIPGFVNPRMGLELMGL